MRSTVTPRTSPSPEQSPARVSPFGGREVLRAIGAAARYGGRWLGVWMVASLLLFGVSAQAQTSAGAALPASELGESVQAATGRCSTSATPPQLPAAICTTGLTKGKQSNFSGQVTAAAVVVPDPGTSTGAGAGTNKITTVPLFGTLWQKALMSLLVMAWMALGLRGIGARARANGKQEKQGSRGESGTSPEQS